MPAGDSLSQHRSFNHSGKADRPWEGKPMSGGCVCGWSERRATAGGPHTAAHSPATRECVQFSACRSSQCVINRARELRARCTTLQTCCTMLQHVVLLRLAVSRARESRAPPRCRLVVLPRAILYCHVPCCTGRTLHARTTRGTRINHAPTANDAKCDVAVQLQCARACLRGLCVNLSVSHCGTETADARACV